MRTTYGDATVRLYHLADQPAAEWAGDATTTLLYGPLEEAIRIAAAEPEEIQAGLFIATDNDVIAWTELRESL